MDWARDNNQVQEREREDSTSLLFFPYYHIVTYGTECIANPNPIETNLQPCTALTYHPTVVNEAPCTLHCYMTDHPEVVNEVPSTEGESDTSSKKANVSRRWSSGHWSY
jgi:hypothetical protein